jgi:hypothetical protein
MLGLLRRKFLKGALGLALLKLAGLRASAAKMRGKGLTS